MKLTILSLGAGVQSTAMALMAEAGEIERPDAAIFADTQNEPEHVYRTLDYVMSHVSYPVHIVTAGNLAEDFLYSLEHPEIRCATPPFYVQHPENSSYGRLWRQCTQQYKLRPIRQKIRELIKDVSTELSAVQMIGISLDEAHRMKPSGVQYIRNCYPLIDKRLSRADCLAWMRDHGHPIPGKSACYYCPYMDDARIAQLDQKSWNSLLELDARIEAIQAADDRNMINAARIRGNIYLNRDCVRMRDWKPKHAAQGDLFGEECEGMCGL